MERSKYAEYFEKEPMGSAAQCKLCVATIALSSRSGTSGMRRHLQRHHNNEFQEMLTMESKMESGSRKRERESSAHEEDNFAKQMKLIENLVYNCSQMTDDSMVQGEVANIFDEGKETPGEEDPLAKFLQTGFQTNHVEDNRVEENGQLNQILNTDYTPTTSAPASYEILPEVSPGCSTSCRTTIHHLQMSLLQKLSHINEVETKASGSQDRELLAQTLAEESATRAKILEGELTGKDDLLMRLQEELKVRDRLLEEEKKRHLELLEEAKRSHAEKDKMVWMRMEALIQKKEELSHQLNTQQAETRVMKFENQRAINDLQSKVDDLILKLKKFEGDQNINGFRGVKEE